MKAIGAQGDRVEVRLWAGSALAALLVHVAPALLLVFYLHWSARPPPLPGSSSLDVELAAMPPAGSPAAPPVRATLPQAQTTPPPAPRPHLTTVSPVLPLGRMQSIPQPEQAPSRSAPAAKATVASSAPVESSDLDDAGSPDPGLQLWEDELTARLASYKQYPRSAVKQLQEDTVKLHISVDPTGQVTHSEVDSTHHYPALEQEVQRMLRLAGRLPVPPAQLSKIDVVTVPVQFGLIKRKGAPARPTLASCTAAASPGPAPMQSSATLQQMRAYRERLDRYLVAAGAQLACLSQLREARALPLRDTLARQLHAMVDDFNAEARSVEARARAQAAARAKAQAQAQALQAQQAQQARQREAQALATRVYAGCTPPRISTPRGALTARDAPSFRRQLVGEQAAVRRYVDCLRQADLAAAAAQRALTDEQRTQLAQTAMQLGGSAIVAFNQVAVQFNAQVPELRQQALAAQAPQNLAEAVVRGTAIFPSSTWKLPAPLPTDNCFRITLAGKAYRAQLCQGTYVTSLAAAAIGAKGAMAEAMQQENIAAAHGVAGDPNTRAILGIAPAPLSQGGQQSGARSQTTYYSVSELQVVGRRLSMSIAARSDQRGGSDPPAVVHLDLVLSPDDQHLQGYCSTGEQRSQCSLTRVH